VPFDRRRLLLAASALLSAPRVIRLAIPQPLLLRTDRVIE